MYLRSGDLFEIMLAGTNLPALGVFVIEVIISITIALLYKPHFHKSLNTF